MGSITDALKAKGATGSNIAECIETLPSSSGGSGDSPFYFVAITYDQGSEAFVSDKTFAEIKDAHDAGKMIVEKVFGAVFVYANEDNADERFVASLLTIKGSPTESNNIAGLRFTVDQSDNATVEEFIWNTTSLT